MRFRPAGWPLPRPSALHHIVEDFLTDWTAPVGHILPLRRFLENCLDTDLRSFYAGRLGSQEDRGAELEGEDNQVGRRPVQLSDTRLETHARDVCLLRQEAWMFTESPPCMAYLRTPALPR